MPRLARLAAGLALLLLAKVPLRADPPAPAAPSPYGDTYTAEELAGLDRALHAGNMTREDLTFRKDMAKGTGCFPVVKELLHDPLLIAPFMDRHAALLLAHEPGRLPGANARASVLAQLAPDGLGSVKAVLDGLVESGDERAEAYISEDLNKEQLREVLHDFCSKAVEWATHAVTRTAKGPYRALSIEQQCVLRRMLPADMAMHAVDLPPSPPEEKRTVEQRCADAPPAHLHAAAQQIDLEAMAALWEELERQAEMLRLLSASAIEGFPENAPSIRETPYGRIALGTPGDDVYTGDYAVILDPDGNDRYVDGRFAAATGEENRRVGLLIDLNGDDVYDCGDVDVTLGAAVLGAAALFDLGQGDDRYVGGHVSLGAGIGGVGILYDDGGSDVYEGKAFTQGAAGYGIGILYDDAVQPEPEISTSEETKDPVDLGAFDNDRLHAWTAAQAFARCRGIALCVNRRGNEVYEAGGVYLHAPLFSDRYQSFSQGFAIGAREHDMAGGIALLIDGAGNDRYLGDIYNQGVGYWYSAGLLYDGGGNDLYEMTQYGQGSGIHLAVGGLVDVGGSDAYVMHSGLGQGGSHDFGASVLHDRGGNDRYDGNTSCNGCGLTNSVGLFFERAGDDTYASKRDGGFNAGRPARGFGSVGVFVDLAGKDDYLGPPAPGGPGDDALWRGSDIGLGLDMAPEAPAPSAPGGSTPAADQPSGKVVEIPAICRYEGALTQAVFDELWALAVRWEVGDNRAIVPEARKRLVVFGKYVAPMLDVKMEKDESGLELRAFVDVLAGLRAQEGGEEVVLDLLRRNAAPEASVRRRRVSLHVIGELKVNVLEGAVVGILKGEDETLGRRAAGVLALLGSQAGNQTLLGWVQPEGDEGRILAALGTLLGTESDVYPQVRALLDHRLVTVRTRLATLLAEKKAIYGAKVLADLEAEDLSLRAVRALLDAVARGPIAATHENHLRLLVAHKDWGVRADAARALQAWLALKDGPGVTLLAGFSTHLAALRQDPDPFVRRMAEPR